MFTSQSPPSATTASLHAALLTPRGHGAIATIRLIGPQTVLDETPPLFHAANGRPVCQQPIGRIVFGTWGRDVTEAVVLCRIEDQILEIHGHGGDRAVARILDDLRDAGAQTVDWPQLTAMQTDVLEAELQVSLSRTVSWRTAEIVLYQADSVLRRAFEVIVGTHWTTADRQRTAANIAEMLRWADFGLHLTDPWRVVLTGRPNVGKSSLVNALLGYQRSIVFDQPGTTRDVVTANTAFDGWPVQLADTAGLRIATESLEADGIARARQQLAQADLIVQLIDLSDPDDDFSPDDGFAASLRRPPLRVAHKCDLPALPSRSLPADAIRVSSRTHLGIEALQHEISLRLVPEAPPRHTPLPLTPRQVTLLTSLRQALEEQSESDFRTVARRLLFEP